MSKPLTKQLIAEGPDVTVISCKARKQHEIEASGIRAETSTFFLMITTASSI